MSTDSNCASISTSVIPVGDIPFLYAAMEQYQIASLLDSCKPLHGNWRGASIGKMLCVWLCYLLSESDHRLCPVESWVAARLPLLRSLTGLSELRAVDFSDDKLAYILKCFGNTTFWDGFMQSVEGSMLQVYRIPEESDTELATFRLDAAPMQGYGTVKTEGLLQRGHNKHHQNLQQIKVKLCTLDNALNNFAYPLYSLTVSGNTADDVLYVPIIEKVKLVLSAMPQYAKGNLFVGDKKFASLSNRTVVVQGGDYYLCPLSLVQLDPKTRDEAIKQALKTPETLTKVYREYEEESDKIDKNMGNKTNKDSKDSKESKESKESKDKKELLAEGFTQTTCITSTIEQADEQATPLEWNERRLFIRSMTFANAQAQKLDNKLKTVEQQLDQMLLRKQGKHIPTTVEECQEMVDALLKKENMADYIKINIEHTEETRSFRAYKGNPARAETITHLHIKYHRDQMAIDEAKRLMGWQVYATNTKQEQLSFEACVWKYRAQANIESRFNDLRNKIVPLLPLYLNKDEHIVGLVNLLTLALKVCTLIEYKVTEALYKQKRAIDRLNEANRKQKMERPTIKRILKAFEHIYITAVYQKGNLIATTITLLNDTQQDLLLLAGIDKAIYTNLPKNTEIYF